MATGGFGGVDPTKRIDDVLRRLDAEVDAMASAHRRLNEAARRLESGRTSGGSVPVGGPQRPGGGLRPGPVVPEPAFVPSGRGGGTVPPIPGNEPARTRALTGARRELNSTTLQQVSVMGAANRRTQQSGALTSQFLEEMRQGRTTLRQFGNEALATAGKFGGWVGAATAVYGLLGAVGQIGEGAMQGQASVELLKRSIDDVDDGSAGARFRALARHFRVGIEDVGQVTFGMGQVYHGQEEAFKAAEAGLLAVKVADLTAEQAYRFLGKGIGQSAGLAADELEGVVDIANKLQEAFGADTGGLIEGTAKAAGTWINAGGQLDYLMALIGVGQSITGASGVEVATAFKRAPGMVRKADAQKTLAELGIDGALPLEDIVRQAMKAAPSMSGEQLRRLGAAIGGPQWGANVITPLLARSDLMGRAFNTVRDNRAARSGRDEWDIMKKQLTSVISEIGVQLQTLGSVLHRTGMLDSFKLLVGLLIQSLRLLNLIGEQFAALPSPVRQMVAYWAQFAILTKGLRALNVSESLPDGRVADFLRHPRQREKLLDRALGETDRALGQEFASNRTAIVRQFRERDLWVENFEAAGRQAADQALPEKDRLAALKAQEVAKAQIIATEERIQQLEVKSAAVLKDQQATAAARADLKLKTLGADEVAVKHGIIMPDALDMAAHQEGEQMRRDAYEQARREAYARGESVPPPGIMPLPVGGGKDPDRLRGEQTKMGRVGADYRRAMAGLRGQMRGQGSMLRKAAIAVRMATASIKAATMAVWGFLGPVGLAFIALMALPTVLKKAGDLLLGPKRRMAAAEREVGALPKRVKEFEEQIKSLEESKSGGPLPSLDFLRTSPIGFLDSAFEFLNSQMSEDMSGLAEALKAEQERGLKELRAGNPDVKFTPGTIFESHFKAEQERLRRRVDAGKMSTDDYQRRLATLAQIGENNNIRFRDVSGALNEVEQDQVELLEARGKMLLAHAKDDIAKAKITAQTAAQVAAAVMANPESSEADIINAQAEVVEAQTALTDRIEQEARELAEAKDNLWVSRARTSAQKAVRGVRAARNALRRTAQASDSSKADLLAARQSLEEAKRTAADDIAEEAIELGRLRDDLRLSGVAGDLARAKMEVENAARNLERVAANPVSDPSEQAKAVMQAQITYNDAVRSMAEQQAQDADDVQSALDRLWVARAGTDMEQSRRSVVAAERALRRLQADPDAKQSEIIDAQTNLVEARKSFEDAVKAEAEALRSARFELAGAKASDDPVAAARVAEREARAMLKAAETPAERTSALAGLINARKSRRDAIAQARLDDISFDADMDRITTQQEIRMLDRMLDTMKLSRSMRRSIKRQIHQLKNGEGDQDFGLNVGSIKLPTIYEIRRAIRGGGAVGQQAGLQYNAVNNVTIHVDGGDPNRVVGALYDAISPNRSGMASAGLVA